MAHTTGGDTIWAILDGSTFTLMARVGPFHSPNSIVSDRFLSDPSALNIAEQLCDCADEIRGAHKQAIMEAELLAEILARDEPLPERTHSERGTGPSNVAAGEAT